jgi:hypothetical protein
MRPNPMITMRTCRGDGCDCVPDKVSRAVYESLRQVPIGGDHNHHRDARAEAIAPLMAAEGWRFCPCYSLLRTEQHARIFELVHTTMANRLAHKTATEKAA